MKLYKQLFALTIIGLITIAIACKKDPAPSAATNTCVAGFGGSLTLTAELQHHGAVIASSAHGLDSIYIKFNTKEFPSGGLKAFDTVIAGKYGADVHGDHIHIKGLKCGKYYLYGAGYDTTIHQKVYGGIPFETTQDTGEVNITIPVTEGD